MLRRYAAFRLLWSARALSYIGDGVATVALLLYVKDLRESGVAVGIILLAQSLPRLLGPFAGALADRVDRKPLMIGCDLGQALIFALIGASTPSLTILLPLVALAALLATAFGPANRSAVPLLVAKEDLVPANAWLGTALNLQLVVGPLVAGVVVSAVGLAPAFLLNSVTFLASALLLARLPSLDTAREGPQPRFFGDVREGISALQQHPLARAVFVTLFLGVAFAALDNVALVFLVRDVLNGSAFEFGVVTSAYGIGMVLASAALIRLRAISPSTAFFGGWVTSGLGTAFTGLAPVIPLAVLTQVTAGAGNGAENVAADTLLQEAVPSQKLGRVFGLTSSAAVAGSTIAYPLGGLVLEATSPRTVFLIAGGGTLLVTLLGRTLLPRHGGRAGRAAV